LQLSVIILNYNTFDLTCQCIQSVIAHTKAIDYEIILVDNASTECNPHLFTEKYPDIKLIKNTQNYGFAKGNNIGISKALGSYILLLNSDTVLLNNAAKLCVDYLLQNPNVGVVTCMIQSSDGTLQFPAERFPSLKNEFRELFRMNKFLSEAQKSQLYLGAAFNHLSGKEADWVWGTFFMFSKQSLQKLPGKQLNDSLFMYGEDMIWCTGFARAGYKMAYYPAAKIIHFGGSNTEQAGYSEKFKSRIFPNTYRALIYRYNKLYVWILYFIKALHLCSLRNKTDLGKALFIFRFLFFRKLH